MSIRIKIYLDGNEVEARVLEEGTYRLGRSEVCEIQLADPSISREHAELRVTSSAVYLSNLSNSGKMLINSQPMETAQFHEGDELRLGPFSLLIVRDASLSKAPPLEEEAAPASGQDAEEQAFGDAQMEGSVSPDAFAVEGSAALDAFGEFENAPEPAQDDFNPQAGFDDPVADLQPVQSTRVDVADQNREMRGSFSATDTIVELKPLIGKLIFSEGPRKGDEIKLDAYEIILGRSKKADIFIDDSKLSRQHVKITRVGMGYRLVDLGSRNGTTVNGIRVLEHPLSSFDEISLGKTKIKFIVHDLGANLGEHREAHTGSHLSLVPDHTKSVQMQPVSPSQIDIAKPSPDGPADKNKGKPSLVSKFKWNGRKPPRTVMLAGALLIGLGVLFLVPSPPSEEAATEVSKTGEDASASGESAPTEGIDVIPPSMPKEYAELEPQAQRKVEGLYQSALRAGEAREFRTGLEYLRQIHSSLSFYKNSKSLEAQFGTELQREEISRTREEAEKSDEQDLAIYLKDGLAYLKTSKFEKAAESFSLALGLDPSNEIANKGMRASELKISDITKVPDSIDREKQKRKEVASLFEKAASAFLNKGYQEAIVIARQIKTIELEGAQDYLREADNIIDRARYAQKEEFEPFLIQAKEKYAEGDFNSARDLCEEMVKRDPAYTEAKDLLEKTRRQLDRLAKEAYVYGYILESMNKIEEAKSYWSRAKNYVRPGDGYYDKVMKKLEYYQ